jgi:choice-of-anchor A domain-containing protein
MKFIRIAFFALALIVAASPAFASSASLGLAGNYNVFIFNDFNSANTDVQGRLAVGGNANIANHGIASNLSGASGNTLVVNGHLTANGVQVDHGDGQVGGTLTGAVSMPNGTLTTGIPSSIDFNAAKTQYSTMSASLSTLAATGTVQDTYNNGGLNLVGDGSSATQVFNLDGSLLSGSNWGLDILSGVGSDDTVIVNVSGQAVAWNISSVGNTLRAYANNVLFNFFEATSLSIVGEAFGSFLAPDAAVNATYGQFNGTLIADSYVGNREFHNIDFTGNVPTPIPGSILLLGTGMLGLIGWRKRR